MSEAPRRRRQRKAPAAAAAATPPPTEAAPAPAAAMTSDHEHHTHTIDGPQHTRDKENVPVDASPKPAALSAPAPPAASVEPLVPEPTPSSAAGGGSTLERQKREAVQTIEAGYREYQQRASGRARVAAGRAARKAYAKASTVETADGSAIFMAKIVKCDALPVDQRIVHPCVKMHVVDIGTKQYQLKSDPKRSVVNANESEVDYLMPCVTTTYDLRSKQGQGAVWAQEFLLNEQFTKFYSENTYLIFELVDMATDKNKQLREAQCVGGWHHIAWGYLKPITYANAKATRAGGDLRLQLYEYDGQKRAADEPRAPGVMAQFSKHIEWYQTHKSRGKKPSTPTFPSTLHITIEARLPKAVVEVHDRAMNALQKEVGTETADEMVARSADRAGRSRPAGEAGEGASAGGGASAGADSGFGGTSRHRWKTGAKAQLPDTQHLVLPISSRTGAMTIAFSNDGDTLAVACELEGIDVFDPDGSQVAIRLFDSQTGKERDACLPGHQDLIYDLTWSTDDRRILSASADASVCIWDADGVDQKPLQQLVHPCFVYTAAFQPIAKEPVMIATGAFDHMLRLWDADNGILLKQISGHKSHINSLTFNAEGTRLFSADGVGVINVWNCMVTGERRAENFKVAKVVQEDKEKLRGDAINSVRLHPRGSKLLCHSRCNQLKMLDLRSLSIVTRYNGLRSERFAIKSDISPDGRYVVSGSEDGSLRVWELDLGTSVQLPLPIGFSTGDTIFNVRWCPTDNMLAICTFGSPQPVILYRFDGERPAQMQSAFDAQTGDASDALANIGRSSVRSSRASGASASGAGGDLGAMLAALK